MIDRLEGFAPCPICGKKDEMFIESEESYKRMLKRYGITRTFVSCDRCKLTIGNEDADKPFVDRKKELMTKWNSLYR